jgi:DNA-binding PadR family transcriptional regulator
MTEYNLSNAELSILSLIAEKPRHGYELEQVIEERGMRNWTEVAFSSIYFLLNGLVKKGLAKSSLQPAAGRGPAKKVFTATPKGFLALHDGIFRSIAVAGHDNQRFLLGLSCLPLLTDAEVEEAFHQRIVFLNDKVAEFSAHPALTQPHFPLHVRAMFEYSLTLIQSELNWSQDFLKSYLKGKTKNGKTGPQKTI